MELQQDVRDVWAGLTRLRAGMDAGFRDPQLSLIHISCIFLEKNTSTRRFMDDFLEKLGIVVEPEFELATSDMIVQFAMRNLGIGCVMSEFAEKEIEAGHLFALEFKPGMPERSFCIITDLSLIHI